MLYGDRELCVTPLLGIVIEVSPNPASKGASMSEVQVLKWIFLPIGLVFLSVAFGLAIVVPLLVLLFYCGKGL